MIAGICAGSISAIVAVLVSLPLHSPDDILFNSATMAVGALITGVAAGALWRLLANNSKRPVTFALLWGLAFSLSAVFGLVGETQLDHFLGFVLPLAAIVFPLTGLLTGLLGGTPLVNRWWLAPVAVGIALAVGIPLAGLGDEESGSLELPPRSSIPLSPQTGDLVSNRCLTGVHFFL